MLGGYAAEKKFFGDITTEASSDMRQATRLARDMVTKWGNERCARTSRLRRAGRYDIPRPRDSRKSRLLRSDRRKNRQRNRRANLRRPRNGERHHSSNTERIGKVAATLIEKKHSKDRSSTTQSRSPQRIRKTFFKIFVIAGEPCDVAIYHSVIARSSNDAAI